MSDKISATIVTRANVYFDGRCVSHTIELPDGSRKSVGVIMPSELTFSTGAPEMMETVAGSCEIKLDGQDQWQRYTVGQTFAVPGNSTFQIRVRGEPYHYVCHFG